MIPLKDVNPTSHRAWVTALLIGVCAVIYFVVQPGGQATVFRRSQSSQLTQQQDTRFTFAHAAIPCEVVRDRPVTITDLETGTCESTTPDAPIFPDKNVYLAVLYSMFLHGSILHIAGNMLFLWIFGNNVEDRFGKLGYVIFYVAAGVVATATYIAFQPHSIVPLVGASGAIAGVMGVYFVLFPNVRIKSLIVIVFPFVFFRDIAAKWLLAFWVVSQFFLSPSSGVAWVAHVGGFVFGVLVGLVFRAATAQPVPRFVPPSFP